MRRAVIGISPDHCTEKELYKLNKAYTEAVNRAGGLAVILPYTADEYLIQEYIRMIDGLLLTGGLDLDPLLFGEEPLPGGGRLDPVRDRFELALIRYADMAGLPVLGICKGCQLMNIARGGTIYQDLYTQKPGVLKHLQEAPRWYPTHRIELDHETKLYGIIKKDSLRVNSIHHQAIKDLSPYFRAAARAFDGVIDAIEAREDRFVLGIQWHPESLWENDEGNYRIFKEFVKESLLYQGRKQDG
ncbi:MAG: gamma-glutamyl-gamma-aminobutyrate hydrolase family protein [Halanaerobiaceae bacterium]|nr:gamma-glutamyl-gamma-aminobutyrate hydrolase family protein [Halanaerobiaceae bacterium]